jgi:hypothetical protein
MNKLNQAIFKELFNFKERRPLSIVGMVYVYILFSPLILLYSYYDFMCEPNSLFESKYFFYSIPGVIFLLIYIYRIRVEFRKNEELLPDGSHCIEDKSGRKIKLQIKNGKRHGTYLVFDSESSSILYSESNYVDGLLHGLLKIYYSDGVLKSEENYREGVLHGLSITYYQNGNKKDEVEYDNGKFHGDFMSYFSSGKLFVKQDFVHGVIGVNRLEYHKDGTPYFFQSGSNFSFYSKANLLACKVRFELIKIAGSLYNDGGLFKLLEMQPKFVGIWNNLGEWCIYNKEGGVDYYLHDWDNQNNCVTQTRVNEKAEKSISKRFKFRINEFAHLSVLHNFEIHRRDSQPYVMSITSKGPPGAGRRDVKTIVPIIHSIEDILSLHEIVEI